MSFTFSVDAPVPPSLPPLLEEAGQDPVHVREGDGGTAVWPRGVLHLFLPGVSVRSVELSWEDELLRVRVLAASAPEDHRLALELVRRAAELTGGDVHAEDGGPFTVEEFAAAHGDDWVARTVDAGVRVTLRLAEERGPVALPGAVREFWVGPRLVGELRAAGPPERLGERLLGAMRAVQYPSGAEDYHTPARLRVVPPGGGGERSAAVWLSDAGVVLPVVDLVALRERDDEGEVVFVPYDAVPGLAGARCRLLDERQYLVDPVPAAEWPALVRAARAHAGAWTG